MEIIKKYKINNIEVIRYYKMNRKPENFCVMSGKYCFESCKTLKDAKNALIKHKNGSFKDSDFYILEML